MLKVANKKCLTFTKTQLNLYILYNYLKAKNKLPIAMFTIHNALTIAK